LWIRQLGVTVGGGRTRDPGVTVGGGGGFVTMSGLVLQPAATVAKTAAVAIQSPRVVFMTTSFSSLEEWSPSPPEVVGDPRPFSGFSPRSPKRDGKPQRPQRD
jgi:hypothetical protein